MGPGSSLASGTLGGIQRLCSPSPAFSLPGELEMGLSGTQGGHVVTQGDTAGQGQPREETSWDSPLMTHQAALPKPQTAPTPAPTRRGPGPESLHGGLGKNADAGRLPALLGPAHPSPAGTAGLFLVPRNSHLARCPGTHTPPFCVPSASDARPAGHKPLRAGCAPCSCPAPQAPAMSPERQHVLGTEAFAGNPPGRSKARGRRWLRVSARC